MGLTCCSVNSNPGLGVDALGWGRIVGPEGREIHVVTESTLKNFVMGCLALKSWLNANMVVEPSSV
jgi:hypothetical protein